MVYLNTLCMLLGVYCSRLTCYLRCLFLFIVNGVISCAVCRESDDSELLCLSFNPHINIVAVGKGEANTTIYSTSVEKFKYRKNCITKALELVYSIKTCYFY